MSNTTPVRLTPEVRRAMYRKHRELIKKHGLSYAVNFALAPTLAIKAPLTPAQKMSKASKARWRTGNQASEKERAKRPAKKPAKKTAKKPAKKRA